MFLFGEDMVICIKILPNSYENSKMLLSMNDFRKLENTRKSLYIISSTTIN